MLKKIALIILCFTVVSTSKAQTWEEWFEQKKTQKKYLLQQIAKLQLYLGNVKKGYNILNEGLSVIGDIKNGDFNLHNRFFENLKKVNPKIKQYARIGDMVILQQKMLSSYRAYNKQFRQAGIFDEKEISYLNAVFTSVLDKVADDIEQLTLLVTDNEMEMTDDERLKRIDNLYSSTEDKYEFMQSFSGNAKLLALQKLKELQDIEDILKMY